jgi:hypothetical protein
MTAQAPRIDERLVGALSRLDDPTIPIAEVNRRVGFVAARLGLVKPSYQQVRVIVHELRRRERSPRLGEILLDIAFRVRPPSALEDYLSGTLPR